MIKAAISAFVVRIKLGYMCNIRASGGVVKLQKKLNLRAKLFFIALLRFFSPLFLVVFCL